ncbi:MAG: methylated-DNA--[protein]-cysteine S-methyltransferase [Gammaproteobacteria bacterium]|nr:methylated-DNA--[protein]-cysteine S-methyltransferase [Gammaproteobacteria bacterium]MCW8909156.1 methylated-DNA--[protein]-cysteine S-methyltransferase [Gammaproteobacteria bacterium]MCW9003718.1 methylated-DNA--[protein]-cysteine S-methyltransferase [Gammaproteobacteria bacterium]MCW9056353.1 methylated-DNA--[protein]-cysteine S-methyltransferase [Gammaproteobacteria bacterium]
MNVLFVATPFTNLRLEFSDQSLLAVDFDVQIPAQQSTLNPLMEQACQQLQAYSVSAQQPLNLPLSPAGTDFQQRVWAVLRNIPVGSVRRYGDIAAELNTSARAVGNACRANPIPLYIPCHRVVAKSGIGGFAGQTDGAYLNIKKALLRHEGVEIPIINPR